MKGLFVSGTDTDVGKTFISALLCHHINKIKPTTYFKPIQAGAPTDFERVKELCPQVSIEPPVYNLEMPASPNRAAESENKKLAVLEIQKHWVNKAFDFCIVEGAGGLLVPINEEEKIIDVARALDLACVLVASTRLGTINHTLLSLEALRNHGVRCLGIVLNGPEDPGLKELLEKQSGVSVLFSVEDCAQVCAESFEALFAANEDLRGFVDFCTRTTKDETKSLGDLDKEHVWHPFTQHGIVKNHPLVKRGEGIHLHLESGPVIDAISSWWVNLLGHAHPSLVQAVQKQVQTLEHVIFAGFTHEPAIELSAQLTQICQERGAALNKVFFSDNGSTAVEVALKMAYQYHQQRGDKARNKFLAFKGSYHGDTLGAMSVGEREGFNKVFNKLMFEVDFVDPFNSEELEKVFSTSGDNYAGVIFEPMVQGASGMRMYPAVVLDRLHDWAEKFNVLKICDEIFTGFYRTGRFFAFEHSQLKPDFLCLSKGLTGGFLPLAVTLTKQEIFDHFNSQDMRQAFLHGHSYTANPIACAVANATLKELTSEKVISNIQKISQWTKECVEGLLQSDRFFRGRCLGTIGALEVSDEDPNYFKGDFSYRFNQACLKQGVLLRPLGGTLYTVPPYCIKKHELETIYEVMNRVLKEEF